MKNFIDLMKEKVLLYDGAKGVMLQNQGLKGEEAAESWNLLKPEVIKNVYFLYRQAGSDVLQANTFPGNRITLERHCFGDRVYQVNYEGVRLAKEVAGNDRYVTASIGPTGLFFEPMGELTFDMAYDVFKEQLRAVEDAGTDAVHFETFTDINELRAAILAAKENTKLPIIASATFEKNNRTLSGNPAEVCAIVCQALGAVVVGANCSSGPELLLETIKKLHSVASVPLLVKANAGIPELINGKTVFSQKPEQFCLFARSFVENGVRLIGGCCGTTPEYIRAIRKELENVTPPDLKMGDISSITSAYCFITDFDISEYTFKAISFDDHHIKAAHNCSDYSEIVDLVCDCDTENVDYLLLDFGNMDNSFDMWKFVSGFSMVVKKPIVVKAESPHILEAFLRYYPGRAGVICHIGFSEIQLSRLEHYGALVLYPESRRMA